MWIPNLAANSKSTELYKHLASSSHMHEGPIIERIDLLTLKKEWLTPQAPIAKQETKPDSPTLRDRAQVLQAKLFGGVKYM